MNSQINPNSWPPFIEESSSISSINSLINPNANFSAAQQRHKLGRVVRINQRLRKYLHTLYQFYIYFNFFSWLLIGAYIWITLASNTLSYYCPDSKSSSTNYFFLYAFGFFGWWMIIIYDRYSILSFFTAFLVFLIARIGSRLNRYSIYKLTDNELNFYADFDDTMSNEAKLYNLGECMMAIKMLLAMIHLEAFFILIMALLHLTPLILRKVLFFIGEGRLRNQLRRWLIFET